MSSGVGSQYYSGFNPLMFGHPCTLWLDSADLNTLTIASGRVSRWADKSGSSNDASQNTFALQPTYSSNGVSFDITRTTVMQLPDASIWSSNNPLSIFFVITPQSNSTTNVYLFQGNAIGDPATWRAIGLYTTGTQYADYWQGAASGNWGTMTVGTTDVTSYIYQQNSTLTAYTNGISNFSRAQGAYTVSNTPAFLGAEPARSLYSTCDIREVIIYQTALNDPQRQQIEGYLAWKWGLRTSRFSDTHMYYSVPPITRAFSPLDISGCAFWIDAADTMAMTLAGSNITAMRDKSPSGRSFTISATNPVYDSNGRNGFGRIQFSGASFIRDASASIPLANRCVFIVAEQTSASTLGEGILSMGGTAAQTDWQNVNAIVYQGRTTTQGSSIHAFANTGDYSIGYGRSSLPMPFGIYTDAFSAGSGTLSLNGYLVGSDTAATPGTALGYIAGARVMASATPSLFLNGFIYEILYYSNALTIGQRRQVEGYLAKKWNAQVTPALSLSTFSPTQIPSCALWLDAADSATLTVSGSIITRWSDKSGNARDVSATGIIRNTGNINGTTATSLTAGNAFFRGVASNTGNSVSVFAVFNMSANSTATARVVSLGNAGVNDFNNALYMASILRTAAGSTSIRGQRNNVGLTTASNVVGIPVMLCSMVNVSSHMMYANGLLTGTTNITTANFNYSNHVIGSSTNPGDGLGYFSGSIGEVIVYNTALVDASRQQVERYLASKWKLSGIGVPSTHPFANRVPLTAYFNPRQISNCGLWLDAADPSTLTLSGSNVSQWNDKSGNGRNAVLQSTFTGATISSSSLKSSLNFVGTSRYLVTYPTFPNTAYSVFTVQYSAVNSGYTRAVHGSQTNQYLFVGTSNGTVAAFTGSGAAWNDVLGTTTTNFQTWRVVGAVVSGSSIIVYADGTSIASKTGTTGTFSDLLIGNDNANTQQWNGNIAEILVYARALSASERQQVEGYLAWKWGLTGGYVPSLTTFSPNSITGCRLWLDAADTTTVDVSGTSVIQWRDKSGNGWNATAHTGNTTYSGRGVVFTGAQMFQTSLSSVIPSQSVFLVASSGGNFSGMAIVSVFSSNLATGYNYTLTSNQQLVSRYDGTTIMTGTTFSQGSPFLYNATVTSGGSSFLYANGAQVASNLATPAISGTNATVAIGAYYYPVADPGPRGNFTGTINEIILFNTILTSTDRQNIEGYLALKWGLQGNLPSTHPYVSRGLPSNHPYKTINAI